MIFLENNREFTLNSMWITNIADGTEGRDEQF